ncbi:MAG: HD domain-containing phosphohydrolase [Phaeospirillum sp.]|nr:HD domain-containing phosphohydrolase [Phaeospirillum sp.]
MKRTHWLFKHKVGRLSSQEWNLIKTHVPKTVDYLHEHACVPHAVLTIAKQHHEKLDGPTDSAKAR